MSKVYKLKLSVKSCQDFKNRIDGFKNELNDIHNKFLQQSVQWIYDRSLRILELDDTFYPSGLSDVDIDVSWKKIEFSDGSVRYNFYYENEAVNWIEFGTGLVGASNPHPKADDLNYGYATGDISSTGMAWKWHNVKYGVYKQNKLITYGYEGKRFIYQACQDYLNTGQPEKIYNQLFIQLKNKYF